MVGGDVQADSPLPGRIRDLFTDYSRCTRLGGARGEATGPLAERLDEVLHRVDAVIRHVRETVFDPAERPGEVRSRDRKFSRDASGV